MADTNNQVDCDFFYFKPGGKWKYEGHGRWPRPQTDGWHKVDRDEIIREKRQHAGHLISRR